MRWVRRHLIRPLGLLLGLPPARIRGVWRVDDGVVTLDGVGYVRRWATREDATAEAARAWRVACDEYAAAHGVRPRLAGPIEWNVDMGDA